MFAPAFRDAVPTLITSGEMDHQVPTRYGRQVHSRIPHSFMHVFTGPRSSHIAFHEMPEEWNAFTLEWMKGQTRRPQ